MKPNTKLKTLNTFYFIFILFGLSLMAIDPLIPVIAENINVGYDKIGIALLIGSLATFITNFTIGRLSDYIDIRKLVLFGLSLLFAGFLIFGAYLNYIIFILVILLLRVGYGSIDTSVHAFSARLFRKNISNTFIKLDICWFLGAFLGPLLISLVLFFDFKTEYLFFIFAFSFMVSMIIFYSICPARNAGQENLKATSHGIEKDKVIEPTAGFLSILKNPVAILTSLILFFYTGSLMSLSTWLTTYFLAFNIRVAYSSAILSLYWLFSVAGLLIVKKLVRKFSEIAILLICCILGTICLSLFIITGNVTAKVIILVFQAILFAGIFPLSTAITANDDPNNSGTVLGFNIAFTFAGSIVFQPIFGYIAEYFGEGFTVFAALAGTLIGLVFVFLLFRVMKKKNL